jgi:hypothetical protein
MVDADAKKLAGATPITGFGRLLLRRGGGLSRPGNSSSH